VNGWEEFVGNDDVCMHCCVVRERERERERKEKISSFF
jgi:hypothetical protein